MKERHQQTHGKKTKRKQTQDKQTKTSHGFKTDRKTIWASLNLNSEQIHWTNNRSLNSFV